MLIMRVYASETLSRYMLGNELLIILYASWCPICFTTDLFIAYDHPQSHVARASVAGGPFILQQRASSDSLDGFRFLERVFLSI